MLKLLRERDVLFATVFVFVFIWLMKFSFVHLSALDPIEKAIEDFDYTDICYKYKKENPSNATPGNIVVVDIGNTREEIAKQIDVINQYGPAVIAVDAIFGRPKNATTDSMLVASLGRVKNLVMGGHLGTITDKEGLSFVPSHELFSKGTNNAYLNFLAQKEKTVRFFKPFEKIDGKEVNSFAVEIARLYDPATYKKIVKRDQEFECINYTKTAEQFIPQLSIGEVISNNPALEMLKGKIVIIGKTNSGDIDDLHFTPFNEELAGRSNPDMAGVFIHANIVDMIVHDNYIHKIPDWLLLIISFIITYLHIAAYVYFFVKNHTWYHMSSKLLQLGFLVVFLFMEMLLLLHFNIKMDDLIILVPIILSVDLLYFYDAIVKLLNKHFGYKTFFVHIP